MNVSGLLVLVAVIAFVLAAFGVRPELLLYVGLACFAASFLPLKRT